MESWSTATLRSALERWMFVRSTSNVAWLSAAIWTLLPFGSRPMRQCSQVTSRARLPWTISWPRWSSERGSVRFTATADDTESCPPTSRSPPSFDSHTPHTPSIIHPSLPFIILLIDGWAREIAKYFWTLVASRMPLSIIDKPWWGSKAILNENSDDWWATNQS